MNDLYDRKIISYPYQWNPDITSRDLYNQLSRLLSMDIALYNDILSKASEILQQSDGESELDQEITELRSKLKLTNKKIQAENRSISTQDLSSTDYEELELTKDGITGSIKQINRAKELIPMLS